MEKLQGELTTGLTRLQTDRNQSIQNLLGRNQNSQKLSDLQAELKRKKKELGILVDQLQATQNVFRVSEEELGKKAQTLHQVFLEMNLQNQFEAELVSDQYVIRPDQSPSEDRSQIYVPQIEVPVVAGEMIHVEVEANGV